MRRKTTIVIAYYLLLLLKQHTTTTDRKKFQRWHDEGVTDAIDGSVNTPPQTMGCFDATNGKKYNTSKVGVEEDTEQQGNAETVIAKLSQEVRLQFVRKVFGIVTIQLLLTFSICLGCTVDPLATLLRSYWFLMFFPFTVAMVIYCYLVCHQELARTHPHNIAALFVFTLFLAVFLGMVSAFYTTLVIAFTILFTVGASFGLILFATQTRVDFTSIFAYLYIFLWVAIVFGWVYPLSGGQYLGQLIYSAIIGFLFSCYLVHHTQMIVGGKHSYQFEIDDYVFAALSLYMDIVQIFLAMLAFGSQR